MIEAELFRQGGWPPSTVHLDELCLRFETGHSWCHAWWELQVDGAIAKIQADTIEGIYARAGKFTVSVIDASGDRVGRFTVESVMCGFPTHSFCFLFSADDEGMWTGHAVNRSFGKLVVVPMRIDPM